MKTKWLVLAGLALAPVTVGLTGCSGGSGGALNLGSGVGGGNQANQFAGVQGDGALVRNGANIGNLQFAVNNNGVINGVLDGAAIAAGSQVRANTTRAVVTTSSQVGADGSFVLNFKIKLNGVAQTLKVQGKLTRSGNNASVLNLQITSTAGGTFTSNLNLSVSGGPGTSTGSFSVSGGNASGGTLNANAGVLVLNTASGLNFASATFVSASSSAANTLTITVADAAALKPGTYSITNDDGTVIYQETPVANPTNRKIWNADTGTITVKSISSTQITVEINSLSLKPSVTPGVPNAASGNITITGSGTAKK